MSEQARAESQRRLLLADDDASTRLLAHASLTAAGFDVIVAANGQEAVEAFLRERPELVLLDIEMPVLDGFEACRRLRRLPGGADVPVVVATSLDDTASVERAYSVGATDFITKPLNWTLLVHRVRYILRTADSANQLRAAESRNRTLLRAMPDSLFLLDAAGRCRILPDSACSLDLPKPLVLWTHNKFVVNLNF